LPRDLDLGRFVNEDNLDLTNNIFDEGSDYYIHQELLSGENYIHELFRDFEHKVFDSKHYELDIYPLIQSIDDNLDLNDFEVYLCNELFHLEEICRQPHYLLHHVIEKVNASRAKRVPSKSYEYLAAHTEDWKYKSIVSFKPGKVLTEELELNYNVYENQLFYALVERCIKYLRGRLKQVKDISDFIEKYKKLLNERSKSGVWFEKVYRNLTLIGGVYKEEKDKNDDAKRCNKTRDSLNAAYKKLLQIKASRIFDDVNKRAAKNIELRDTNVLVNHKHYRYVRELWGKLNRIRPEKTDEVKKIEEQTVISGLRAYAKTLFAYTVKHMNYNVNLNYELEGTYEEWYAINSRLASIAFKENDDNTFNINVGRFTLRFIVLGNVSNIDLESLPLGTYLLCYSEKNIDVHDRVILINPMDPDSAERLGKVINQYLLSEYVLNIQREYEYPQSLRDFVHHIDAPWITFNNEHNHYTYSFIKPGKPIDRGMLSSKLVVGRDIRDDQKKELLRFIDEIELNYQQYVQDYLFCFHCQSPMNLNLVDDFRYIECTTGDGFVLDISQSNKVVFKNIDSRYQVNTEINIEVNDHIIDAEIDKVTDEINDAEISEDENIKVANVDWGLDCLEFSMPS
jgi:hypothetical protein